MRLLIEARGLAAATLLTTSLASAGCNLDTSAATYPEGAIAYPMAVAAVPPIDADTGSQFLLLANGNNDVRYGSGALQSFRLVSGGGQPGIVTVLREQITDDDGQKCDPTRGLLADGGGARCEFKAADLPSIENVQPPNSPPQVLLADYLVRQVAIGSQVDGMALSPNGERIYMVVRSGSGVLTWVDLVRETGELDCGDPGCDDAHRRTDTSAATMRGFTLPTDPVAVSVGQFAAGELPGDELPDELKQFVVVVHRGGRASLFIDDVTPDEQPKFVSVLEPVRVDVVSAKLEQATGLTWLTSAGLGTRASRVLEALAVVPGDGADGMSAVNGSSLTIARVLSLSAIDDGTDTRDIVFDDSGEHAWVLSRRPEALVTLNLDRTLPTGEASLGRVFPVGSGPSRVVRAEMTVDADGEGEAPSERRSLFVVTLTNGRAVQILDPELGVIASVAGMTMPYEVAVADVDVDGDGDGELVPMAFVTDYTDSVLWVIDLGPLAHGGSPYLLGRVGTPNPPRIFQ